MGLTGLHTVKKPHRTVWSFAIWRHIVLKRSMSGYSVLEP